MNTNTLTQEPLSYNNPEAANLDVESLPPIVWDQASVITTGVLAKLYGASESNIQDNYRRNAERFVAGKHYFKLEGDTLKQFKKQLTGLKLVSSNSKEIVPKHTRHVVLWTERGAARHAKMLETDQAWEVFEKLEDSYFSRELPADQQPPRLKPTTKALPGCLTTDQQDAIKEMVRARVETLPHEKQKGAAIRCWSSLKSKFGVTYKEIPSEHYPEAVSLLARLPLDGEVIEKQPDQDIIQQAFGFGATVAGEVVKSMVSAMIEGSTDLNLDRWMVSLDSDGRPYARAIDRQAIVCSIPKLAKEIGAPCGIMATDKELLELAMACNHALSIRLRGRGVKAQ